MSIISSRLSAVKYQKRPRVGYYDDLALKY